MQEENKEPEEEPLLKEDKYVKKSTFNSFILVAVVVIILVLLLVGIKFFRRPSVKDITQEIIEKGSTEQGYIYNGFVFIEQNDL